MKLLIYKDLILSYIRQEYDNDEHMSLIQKILYNENSVFLYSLKFINFLEREIGDNSRHYNRFTSFVTKIQKEMQQKGNITSSQTSQCFDDEILHIFSTTQDNVVVVIASNQPSQEIQNAIPNIAVLSQQQKPNYHWLVVNLAILHPFTLSVDEIDFDNDAQTDKFFDDLFSIPRTISEVTIFDDYYNVNEHNKYAKIAKPKNVFVLYCTQNHYRKSDWNGNFNADKYNILKANFSKFNLSTKDKGSHTRRIIFEGFIINPDIDLGLLNKTDKKMWSVHIRFSEERAGEIIEIRNKDYKKFNPSR